MRHFNLFFLITICFLGVACGKKNTVVSEDNAKPAIMQTDTAKYNCDMPADIYDQYHSVDGSAYRKISKGKYITKSTQEEYINWANSTLAIHQLSDSNKLNGDRYMYLANDKPIALFNKMHPSAKEDVAGLFLGGSLVYVDTIYYNAIYNDSDKAPMSFEDWFSLVETESFNAYPLTYDVWYAININGKKYYTDYKLHNNIEVKQYLPSKNQIVLICSQSTGYDGGYDRGYPDFYEVTVLEESKVEKGLWERVYRSAKLDLNDGGADEYGLSEAYFAHAGSLVDRNGNFDFNVECCFRMVWDGKELSITWTDEYLTSIKERERSAE